jgi:hypothetical protein
MNGHSSTTGAWASLQVRVGRLLIPAASCDADAATANLALSLPATPHAEREVRKQSERDVGVADGHAPHSNQLDVVVKARDA